MVRCGHGAVHQDALVGEVKLGAGLGAQRHMIALANTMLQQTCGDLFGGLEILVPRPGMNVLAVRLAQCELVAKLRRGIVQKIGNGHSGHRF